jgi:5-methylcytosine-specific restriction protein A
MSASKSPRDHSNRYGWYPHLQELGLTVAQCSAWHRLRRDFRARVTCCAFCGIRFSAEVRCNVDHIKPHRGNLTLLMDRRNLQGLCGRCHSGSKRLMENAANKPQIGLDGWPVRD